jgi:hypothetical protein
VGGLTVLMMIALFYLKFKQESIALFWTEIIITEIIISIIIKTKEVIMKKREQIITENASSSANGSTGSSRKTAIAYRVTLLTSC